VGQMQQAAKKKLAFSVIGECCCRRAGRQGLLLGLLLASPHWRSGRSCPSSRCCSCAVCGGAQAAGH
jgi:hypothetical protein